MRSAGEAETCIDIESGRPRHESGSEYGRRKNKTYGFLRFWWTCNGNAKPDGAQVYCEAN